MIAKNRHLYHSCPKHTKLLVSKTVVKAVQTQGGRFVDRDRATGQWYLVSMDRAVAKTSQCLRERNDNGSRRYKRKNRPDDHNDDDQEESSSSFGRTRIRPPPTSYNAGGLVDLANQAVALLEQEQDETNSDHDDSSAPQEPATSPTTTRPLPETEPVSAITTTPYFAILAATRNSMPSKSPLRFESEEEDQAPPSSPPPPSPPVPAHAHGSSPPPPVVAPPTTTQSVQHSVLPPILPGRHGFLLARQQQPQQHFWLEQNQSPTPVAPAQEDDYYHYYKRQHQHQQQQQQHLALLALARQQQERQVTSTRLAAGCNFRDSRNARQVALPLLGTLLSTSQSMESKARAE